MVIKSILRPLASLRLMVTLLAMSMVLIFAGTLAQRDQGNWQVVGEYFRSLWLRLPLRNLLFLDVPGWIMFPGGYTLCGLLLVNLLAAHAIRFNLSRNRIGILVIHAGIILLLIGELLTGTLANEAIMTIHEGGYANFTEDLREVELAIIDPSDPSEDLVIVIPESILRRYEGDGPIPDPDGLLPFEMIVNRWMENSQVLGPEMIRAEDSEPPPNLATEGWGRMAIARPIPSITGVNLQQVDLASVYVSLRHHGEPSGVFLLTQHLQQHQPVMVGGKTYQLILRFKRAYKPYTMHLIEFRHDQFLGTDIPRNFSSLVRLVDPQQNEDRQVLIYMNEPLYYRGESFYQFQMDPTRTVLQVVQNPGWALPYLACALVAAGLLVHFSLMMLRFVRRGVPGHSLLIEGSNPAPPQQVATAARSDRSWGVIGFTSILVLGYLAARAQPPKNDEGFNLHAFGSIPVTAEGRVKPLDTVARSSLLKLSDRQTFSTQNDPRNFLERLAGRFKGDNDLTLRQHSAIRWLADVLAQPELAQTYPVFRIDMPDVRGLLELEASPRDRFSFKQIMVHRDRLVRQALLAGRVPPAQLNLYQKHLLELAGQASLYHELQMFQRPYSVPPQDNTGSWMRLDEAMAAMHSSGTKHPPTVQLTKIIQAYRGPDPPGDRDPESDAVDDPVRHLTADSNAVEEMDRIQEPVRDFESFNREVANYLDWFTKHMPQLARRARIEVFFNRFAPFYASTVLYVIAFMLACMAILCSASVVPRRGRALAVAAVTVLILTFLLHGLSLGTRMYLQGRPPVTNLYSSAVFIGWICVLLGLVIEVLFRNLVGTLIAALIGFATGIVAHNLATGDTLEMLQAVLDTNFWLATHVVAVTIGYAATFLAGFLGIGYVLTGVYTRQLTQGRATALTKMLYGVIAFALLFSFTGTVLGGIWADQSWGRFWGWDPKENGAALIVLGNALILHARWAGMIGPRGVAVLAIGGNIITSWSWFGTNMLGVGLHAYGRLDPAIFWLMAFVVSQIALLAVGLLPRTRWASYPIMRKTSP